MICLFYVGLKARVCFFFFWGGGWGGGEGAAVAIFCGAEIKDCLSLWS